MTNTEALAAVETWLRRYIDGDSFQTIANEYGCNWQTVRKHVNRQLSPEYAKALTKEHRHANGLLTKFKPGHHTSSEYKRGTIRGMAARRYLPIGAIRIYTRRVRGKVKPDCRMIKVDNELNGGPKNWKPVAVYNWEKAHGPVPKGWAVIHIDGNRMNDAIENLKAIPPQQQILHAMKVRPKRFSSEVLSRTSKRNWQNRKIIMEGLKNLHKAV